MNEVFCLDGKKILVTGGTRGIGRAVSLRCARAGAQVIANYVRNDDAAAALQEEAEQEKLSIAVCRADLTGKKGLERLDQTLTEIGESLSGLVYCAATGVHMKFEEMSTRHFDWTFALNVRAFFELVKLCLKGFTDNASIIAVSSQGALRAVPSYSVIGASKGALESFSRHLAAELAGRGIRVNILSPGSVLTDAWEAMPDKEKRIQDSIDRTPIGRLVTAEEVACAAQFLCSDASSGITGQTLVIDGGAGIVA